MDENLLFKFNAIADGLAEDGIAVVDSFLNSDEVKSIGEEDEFKDGLLQFKKAGIGQAQERQINESIRGDYIQWIDPASASAPIQIYLEKLSRLRTFLNQSLFLSLKDVEVHKTIYPPQSYYKRHLDQFKKDDHRKLSVICYLNEEWKESDGGQLRVYFPDGSKDFFPIAGRLVCFRSDLLEHEVLPTERPRMSLTGWMLDR
ncbi:MAG: 2OG-Fe(II) oxygenase [Bacteroidetes bacterium]|nr:2OG-Fe(II) oxygenase [Bacteroidota bacterium]MBI3483092.1 2OG-Fe(II) oxygenase [Bacteroidota bacterium]